MIFCFFLLINLLITNRFTQKVMGLRFFTFYLANILPDLLFRLPSIFFILLTFKYRDEFRPHLIPYRKNKELYFALLLISTFQILTHYYMWCLKTKKGKPNKIIFIGIMLCSKRCLNLKLTFHSIVFGTFNRRSS